MTFSEYGIIAADTLSRDVGAEPAAFILSSIDLFACWQDGLTPHEALAEAPEPIETDDELEDEPITPRCASQQCVKIPSQQT